MTPLMYAVKDNRMSYLDRLIDLGSDVGARNNVSEWIESGQHNMSLREVLFEK